MASTQTADTRRRYANLTNAVSADGSRVYWTDSGNEENLPWAGSTCASTPAKPQSPLDGGGQCEDPAAACTLPVSRKAAQFWAASTDGSKALYTLTEGAATAT